uniref:Reverse transcriptase zinc-binding domain-containing protein n=1 Tax=Lactuca sativa TaxID=4236 RepID=A0A9R1XWU4_LACSA|nr:hypothetical protein LSAT_V11C100035260 [Lactuca sativa]
MIHGWGQGTLRQNIKPYLDWKQGKDVGYPTKLLIRPMYGVESLDQPTWSVVCALSRVVSDIRLGTGSDHWSCKLTVDGKHLVSSLRKIVDATHVNILNIPGTSNIVWCKAVPIKVLCFIWRAAQDRIPIAVALEKRGIVVNSTLCCSCIRMPECADHILMGWPFATVIRNNILGWCGQNSANASTSAQNSIKNVYDLLHLAATWCNSQRNKESFVAICYGLLWNLWRFMNKRLFQMEGISPIQGTDCIKSMLKHRSKNGICNWVKWLDSPFSDL